MFIAQPPPVQVQLATVDITSCASTMDGALVAISFSVSIPSAVTTCVGAVDGTLFFVNPSTPMIADANSIYSVMVTEETYSGTVYLAPVSPCGTNGSTCAVGIVFSCYEPSSSTIFVGGNGETCA